MTTAPSPRDWHAVAHTKLANVLGPRVADEVMTGALRDLALARLQTAGELSRFAQHIAGQGGFITAVAGLLSVHVAMYGESAPPGPRGG